MANHKSAIKRHRQSLKRRDRNRVAKTAIRTAIKDTRIAAQSGDKKKALELLAATEKMVAKSATRGIYHQKNASCKIGRLTVYVNATLKNPAQKTAA